MRIKHLDVQRKIKELIKPDFHVLFDGEKIVAVIVFCRREYPLREVPRGYYIRYFSVDKDYQHLGLGKYLVREAVNYYKGNLSEPTLVYAYIEGENIKSLSVSNHFDPVINSSFKVLFFNRLSPGKNQNCKRVEKVDIEKIKEKVAVQNQNFISYNSTRIGYENNYFILERNGEIVAGLQAILTKWEIINNPGFSGFLIQNILSKIPYIKRLAQGRNMEFVAVEGVYYESVEDFQLLLEHVLAELKQYMAFIYLDVKDLRLKELQDSPGLGLMSKIQKSPQINILHFGWKLGREAEASLKNGINYISAYDVT